jgi:hypothetical protein
LPKKAGGKRVITVPTPILKRLQRRIYANGLSHLPLPEPCHGFRPGRSIVTNARPHARQLLVVNVDIQAFFPSTSLGAVKGVLKRHYSRTLSGGAIHLLSEICCFNGALPTGAPTSPTLANLVLAPVDRALEKAAARFKIAYTRYADDLTFSGDGDTKKLLPFVVRILKERGYSLDPKKTHLYRRGKRQMVTGLVVNEEPHVPRHVRRLLRAAVHRTSRGLPPEWHGNVINIHELRGRLAQLSKIHPAEFMRLTAMLPRNLDNSTP